MEYRNGYYIFNAIEKTSLQTTLLIGGIKYIMLKHKQKSEETFQKFIAKTYSIIFLGTHILKLILL
ncbi:MAG: hypothetical protein ACI9FN_003145 [Saprospiraceae bacterium]|jgi:hypothetical protein